MKLLHAIAALGSSFKHYNIVRLNVLYSYLAVTETNMLCLTSSANRYDRIQIENIRIRYGRYRQYAKKCLIIQGCDKDPKCMLYDEK